MIKFIEKVQLAIGIICFSIFVVAIMIQVFSRYLGISVIWTEEVANFSFIWSVFMGASIMMHHKEHFRFTLLSEKLEGKSKVYQDIVVNVILLIFNLAILFYGILTVQNFWNYQWVSLPMLKMGYVWLCVPVMGLSMSIYAIDHLMNNIRTLNREEAN
ncbi:TRAP transporter small permease [Petroclostridium sp. X23]|uniref:TRAP transporter small permease n=1 Tax=Petroclostridium sp. X23 TaxID=3045146 RepID=UPI0024AE1F56|nr:TRAP transporter small permease [Petroclostridium sp. X23]WHH59229.1 TRAP transporter small permease [Petroclostridium sp. X23]